MTKQLRIMVGLPGSGKSTFAQKSAKAFEEEKYTTAVISRDVIRFSMLKDDEDYFAKEKEVFSEFIRQINESMEVGIDIIYVDATHLNKASRRKLLNRLRIDPKTTIVFDIMDTPFDVCLSRNNQREGRTRVPQQALKRMASSFALPTDEEYQELGLSNRYYFALYSYEGGV